MCVCAQHEASVSASCIWAAQSYFRTACALEQWQSSTLRGAKTARKCGPIPYSQWCKGVGLLNSGFCLLQRWTFRTSRFSPGVVTDIGHVIIQPCWVCLNSTWKRTKPITLKRPYCGTSKLPGNCNVLPLAPQRLSIKSPSCSWARITTFKITFALKNGASDYLK